MTDNQNETMKRVAIPKGSILVGPDPVSSPEMLHAGSFLYFDAPLLLTVPPMVFTAEESFKLMTLIESANPEWAGALHGILTGWKVRHDEANSMLELLEPLKGASFEVILPVYSADDVAMNVARELIASTKWSSDRLLNSVGFKNPAGELVRHIFLEKFLEFNGDLDALFEYCGGILKEETLSEALACAYVTRLNAVFEQRNQIPIAFTNSALIHFLADLPAEAEEADDQQTLLAQDSVSMVIFNTLLSNWLDPLTEKNVEVIAALHETKRAEIDKLKGKCMEVANNINLSQEPDSIFSDLTNELRYKVMPDIREFLEISETRFATYIDKLMEDKVFWTSFIGTIVSVYYDQPLVSAAASISALGSMTASAFAHTSEREAAIKKSDLTLIYTIGRLKN